MCHGDGNEVGDGDDDGDHFDELESMFVMHPLSLLQTSIMFLRWFDGF